MVKHTTIIRSPAKLNLMLRVLDKRSDGYHNLQTVFQFIDLFDILEFSYLCDSDKLEKPIDFVALICNGLGIGTHDNLIIKAAKCLQQTPQYLYKYKNINPPNIKIKLTKSIPIGAGLGGGSSNCAMTLLALNQFWDLGLNTEALQKIGQNLGADVPIFIYGKSAWAEGVGEKFNEIYLPEREFGLISPNIHISTPLIFQSSALKRDNPKLSMQDFLAGMQPNDCTNAIFYHFPVMKALMLMLDQNGFDPQITGTGASIFLRNPPESENAIKIILNSIGLSDSRYQKVKSFNTLRLEIIDHRFAEIVTIKE